jgi:hypothetical protein
MAVTWGKEGSVDPLPPSESEEPPQLVTNDKSEKQINITKHLRILSTPFHLETYSKFNLIDWDLKEGEEIRA